MAIQLGGLATGLDTNALIQQLLAVQRQPLNSLQAKQLKLQALSTTFQDLNIKLNTLESQAGALRDPGTFFARSVTSSDTDVATATVAPGVARGTFDLTVTSLARGSIATANTTQTALTDTVASGDGVLAFRLGADGALISVPVSSTTTLGQLVQAINERNAGVRATAVDVGTPSGAAWKLTLTSSLSGSANDITIVTDTTKLGVTNTQHATDAVVTVAGIGTFTRPTNTLSDVVDGAAITVKAAGSTELVVDYDASATQSRLQALLDAYNTVVRTIDGQSRVATAADGTVTPGAFTGDVIPRQIRQHLAAIVATRFGGSVGSLADLGVTTQDDGTLALDATKFQAALTRDPDAVRAVVSGQTGREGVAALFHDATDVATRAVTGTIAVRRDGLTSQMRTMQKQVDDGLARLSVTEQTLRAQFTRLETTVARLQSTGNALLAQLGLLASTASGTTNATVSGRGSS